MILEDFKLNGLYKRRDGKVVQIIVLPIIGKSLGYTKMINTDLEFSFFLNGKHRLFQEHSFDLISEITKETNPEYFL